VADNVCDQVVPGRAAGLAIGARCLVLVLGQEIAAGLGFGTGDHPAQAPDGHVFLMVAVFSVLAWGYSAHDHAWKSDRELIRNLIDIASKGGNYLLNTRTQRGRERPGGERPISPGDRRVDAEEWAGVPSSR
jgi:hypothetical protein